MSEEEKEITPKDVMEEITGLRSEIDGFIKGWVECPTCQVRVRVKDHNAVCPVCKAVFDGKTEKWTSPQKEKSGKDEGKGKRKKFLSW